MIASYLRTGRTPSPGCYGIVESGLFPSQLPVLCRASPRLPHAPAHHRARAGPARISVASGAIIAELLVRTCTIALLQGSSGRGTIVEIHVVADPARLGQLDLVILSD